MKKIKSALEIAMERAEKIDDQLTPEEEEMIKREEVKPLLIEFYKNKINADGLWQKLKEKGDRELYRQVQLLLLDSIGLKTTSEQLKKRKEGLLAVENLKKSNNTSIIEQSIDQISSLQKKYKEERNRYQAMYEEAVENAEMSMKPVRTSDGKTVMQLQQSLDEETEKRLKNALTQLETRSEQMLNQLLDNIKSRI